MFFTHDFVHGVRIAEMARALQDGHFPVRWSSNFGYGYGMPLFEFYAPLPFYVGAILYLLGVPLVLSVKLLFLLANVLTVWGAYKLGAKLAGPKHATLIGLVTAALIALAPYRALNMYIRGALSETWGIMALVWVIYSTILVLQRKKYSQFILIASLVAMFLSHNLLTMIAVPFVAIWTIGMFVYTQWSAMTSGTEKIWKLILAHLGRFTLIYVLAVAAACFYVVPAFAEKDFTRVQDSTTGGYFSYELHFLYIRQLLRPGWAYGGSEWGPDDKLSFFIGYGQIVGVLLAAVAGALGLLQWIKTKEKTIAVRGSLFVLSLAAAAVGLALFMTLGKAKPIWDQIEFFSFIQFPWRFYSPALIFIGVVTAVGLRLLSTFLSKKLLLICAAVVLSVTIGVNYAYFRPEYYLDNEPALYYDSPEKTREHMSGILPDYIPVGIPQNPPVSTSLINCAQFSVCGNVQVLEDKTQEKVIDITMLAAGQVTLDIANYPGWEVQVDGQKAAVMTSTEGLITVQVPEGEHQLIVRFGSSPVRQVADLLSLISISIVIGWALFIWLKSDFEAMPDTSKTISESRISNLPRDIELEQTPAGSTQSTEEEEAATMNAIKTKSVSGAFSYFARTILLQAVGLSSALILGAFFSPEDFGLYGLVVQVIGILIFLSDIGLAAALIQKKDEPSQQDYATVFTVQQLLSWAIVLICGGLIYFGVFADKLGVTGNWILFALALSFPLAAMKTIPSIILERKLDFSKLVIPQVIEQLSFHAILIYMAWNGAGAIAYAYAIIARSVLGVITIYRIAPWKISVGIYKDALHTLLSIGMKFQLNDALARVKDQLFFMVIGLYFPLNQFGFIQWAKNWSLYPYNLTVQNVMAITFSTFSRLQHNKQLLRRAIEKSLFFICLLIFPIIAGMSVYVYPMVLLTPEYHQWLPALPSFILFTISVLFSAIASPLVNALNAVGEINKTLRLMVLWTILTWLLTPICIFFFGFTGVSVSALLIGFSSVLPIVYIKRVVELSVWDQIWRPFLGSVVLAGVGLGLQQLLPISWLSLILIMLLSGLSYVGALLIVGRAQMIQEIGPFVAAIRKKV